MVNLALTSQKLGWYTKMYTPAYDTKRAFHQSKDGTLPIEVHGNFFPRLICGKFQVFYETVKMTFCALYLIFFGTKYDLDQIPFPLIFLRWKYKTLFYCHNPDKVLCVNRSGILKKIYRLFIDLSEEIMMCFVNLIVVNSLHTPEIYLKILYYKENLEIYRK